MSYCEYKNGIKICSNIPFDSKPSSGSYYSIDVKFKIPIAAITVDLYDLLSYSNFSAMLLNYYTGKIYNYSITSISQYDLLIKFQADSPAPLIIAAVITAILAIIAFIVLEITITVSKNPALSIAAPIFAIAALGITGLAIYHTIKKRGNK